MPAPVVLHILSSSGREGTGIARVVSSLHRHIARDEFDLRVCFVGTDGPLAVEFQRSGIPADVVSWRHPGRDPVGLLRLLRHIRRVHPDVLHFHWGGPHIRQFAAKFTGAKIVQHMHSMLDESSPAAGSISSAHADAVVAISKAVASCSAHPRTRVIYSGVEIDAASHSRTAAANIIGSAGRLAPVKGIAHLLHAIALLRAEFPLLHLEIAGDGPQRGELEALSVSLGLGENVRFLGWVEPLRPVMQQWSLLVQPSLEEGLSLTALEAMACGLPVIASRVGGLPEVVEEGCTGYLVPPADPRSLADGIKHLLTDASTRDLMAINAYARVQERFQAREMAAHTASLYGELLAK